MANNTQIKTVENKLKEHQCILENMVEKRTCELRESEIKFRLLYEKSKLQEELYRSILSSSSDAIIVYEMTGLVQYVNPAFSEMFGWDLEELKDQRIPFLPESERKESMKQIMALIHDGVPCREFRTKRLSKSGQLIDISLSASRYADHRGEPAGMLVILRDISKRVRAEQEALKVRKLESVGVLAGGHCS